MLGNSEIYDPVFAAYGKNFISNGYINVLRDHNMSIKADEIRNWIPQRGFQEEVLRNDADILIIGGKRGGGKVLPNDAKIVTPFGIRTNGELRIGSTITDPCTGGMERVIQIFEHPNHEFYEIQFDDGSCVECGLEHLWKVRQTGYTKKRRMLYGGGVEDDYRIWTFEKIKNWLDEQAQGKHYDRGTKEHLVIPLTKPVRFTKSGHSMRKNSIDPYMIGLILGDGCLSEKVYSSGVVELTTADDEIIDYTTKHFNVTRITPKDGTDAKEIFIKDETLNEAISLCRIGGCKSIDKFIPTCYKYGTIDERFAIVQGLMDTDGYIDNEGRCASFTSISKRLAEDTQFVLRSLGASAKIIVDTNTGYRDSDGNFVKCNDAYTVYIRIADTRQLFRLSRKKNRCTPYNGGVSEVARRIVGYKYVGRKDGRCITVDSPNSLYLTNDFIVTHNTMAVVLAPMRNVTNNNFQCVGFRKEEDDIRNGLWKDSKVVYEKLADKKESEFQWTFPSGAIIKYVHLANENEVDRRFRGLNIPFMIIDEVTQISFKTFFTLLASNRNNIGVRNQFIGTCNPVERTHWLYRLIEWYIDESTGRIREDRNGKKRYFYKYGETINEIYWGDSKEEVYEKAKEYIDLALDPATGLDWRNLINSICFIEGRYAENKIFIKNDPNYLGNLAQQGGAQAIKDLQGIWGGESSGNCEITAEEFQRLFDNPIEQRTGFKYAIADVAIVNDELTLGAFDGHHLYDVEVYKGVGSMTIVGIIRNFLNKHHLSERQFAFDSDGVGQYLKEPFHSDCGGALPFNGNAQASDTQVYYNVKSECFDKMIQAIKESRMSIAKEVQERKMPDGRTFREHLETQRRVLIMKADARKRQFIAKREMKNMLGKKSPDELDMLGMSWIFDVRKRNTNGMRGLSYLSFFS